MDLVLVDRAAPVAAPCEEHLVAARTRRMAAQRRRSRKRRRDIVLGLCVTTVATAALGAVHELHLLWALTALSVLGIAGYVALAAYAQLLDADDLATRPIDSVLPNRELAPWERGRPRHAAGGSMPGVDVIVGTGEPWAARAGYPGAWDHADPEGISAPRHAVAGG